MKTKINCKTKVYLLIVLIISMLALLSGCATPAEKDIADSDTVSNKMTCQEVVKALGYSYPEMDSDATYRVLTTCEEDDDRRYDITFVVSTIEGSCDWKIKDVEYAGIKTDSAEKLNFLGNINYWIREVKSVEFVFNGGLYDIADNSIDIKKTLEETTKGNAAGQISFGSEQLYKLRDKGCVNLHNTINFKGYADYVIGKNFRYTIEDSPNDFIINIYNDGTFRYIEGAISSSFIEGKWTISDNILTLAEKNRTNRFRIDKDMLAWISDGSDNFMYTKVNNEDQFVADVERCVMVDGVLYYDTYKKSSVDNLKDTPDGKIESECPAGYIPCGNNQGNFGKGYGYQYGLIDGTIDVCINNNDWHVFATKDVKEIYPNLSQNIETFYSMKLSN